MTHVTDTPPALPAYLPENMPDLRAAQRLLALVDQLEAFLKARPALLEPQTAVQPVHVTSDNDGFRKAQTKALARLDNLLERLDAQTKADAEAAQEKAA